MAASYPAPGDRSGPRPLSRPSAAASVFSAIGPALPLAADQLFQRRAFETAEREAVAGRSLRTVDDDVRLAEPRLDSRAFTERTALERPDAPLGTDPQRELLDDDREAEPPVLTDDDADREVHVGERVGIVAAPRLDLHDATVRPDAAAQRDPVRLVPPAGEARDRHLGDRLRGGRDERPAAERLDEPSRLRQPLPPFRHDRERTHASGLRPEKLAVVSAVPRPQLRPATADDADFVYGVLDEAIGPYVRAHEEWDEAAQRDRVRRLLETAETSLIAVDGHDVGYVSIWRNDDELYVASIALARRWRGRGLGTVLMQELIDEAARNGVPVRLSVLEGNPARGLYERLGFAVTRVDGRNLRMELPPPATLAQAQAVEPPSFIRAAAASASCRVDLAGEARHGAVE